MQGGVAAVRVGAPACPSRRDRRGVLPIVIGLLQVTGGWDRIVRHTHSWVSGIDLPV